jgi:LmbE family N-acetylglucosaminyl deacetylase
MRFIVIGAHPDDCEYRFAGTAIKLVKDGHAIKFVSMSNGDGGHHLQGGATLTKRREAEAQEAGRRLGVAAYDVLDNHDGELLPTLENRQEVIRQIREWQADVVLSHRPNDYHPDHRYTGSLVQDSAYMVTVPNICPSTPALRRNPVYFYLEDEFRKPVPFSPDVVVDIDDTWEKKVDSLDAHVSQFYEWLPWLDGKLDEVPDNPAGRKKWLDQWLQQLLKNDFRTALERRYGAKKARNSRPLEAFELCEYGRQPSAEDLNRMFPL